MLKNLLNALGKLFPFLKSKEPSTGLFASVGDITLYTGDAIVNAANSELRAGGGVCGAIFKAAGRGELQAACDKLGECPTGSAKTTPAFNLPSKHVIHAVGPIYDPADPNMTSQLAGAYTSSLREALRVGAKSIAFPAISTGIYGYPLEAATKIAIDAVQKFCSENKGIERVDFVCFSPEILVVYNKHLGNDTPKNQCSGCSCSM